MRALRLLCLVVWMFEVASADVRVYGFTEIKSGTPDTARHFVADTEAELLGASASEGDIGYAKDTNQYYQHNGTTFIAIASGSGAPTTSYVFLAADDARSVTAKNDMAGMSFTLAANTNYSYECKMFTTANAATVGVQFAITFGGTVTAGTGTFQGPGAATTLLWINDVTAYPHDFNPTASQGNVAGMVTLSGTIEVSGTGGTLQFQHGSETATLTTVKRGSWCQLAKH